MDRGPIKYRTNLWMLPEEVMDTNIVVEPIITRTNVRVERRICSGTSVMRESVIAPDDMWILLLQGDLYVEVENYDLISLKAGEILHIPKDTAFRISQSSQIPPAISIVFHLKDNNGEAEK